MIQALLWTDFSEPLRNRPEDIPHLIEHYGNRYALQFNKQWPCAWDEDTLEQLCEYCWPGNVRELQNVLRRIIVTERSRETIASMMNGFVSNKKVKASGGSGYAGQVLKQYGFYGNDVDLKSLSLKKIKKQAADVIEKQVIAYVLDKTGWNRSNANKILGISYKTLLSKIQEFGLTPPPDLY